MREDCLAAITEGRAAVFLSDCTTWDVATGCTVRFYADAGMEGEAAVVSLEQLIQRWLAGDPDEQ